MNIYVTSEQIGLEGYWITDILAGIGKEALKKNLSVIDYNGKNLEIGDEFIRPLVLAVGYSAQWMESTCNHMTSHGIQPILVTSAQSADTEMLSFSGIVSFGLKKAMYNVLNYLVLSRRNRIAFFGGHGETHADNVKAAEFLALSHHFGLNINKSDIYMDTSLSDCAKTFEMSMHRYNAVICSSDAAAVFLLKWLEERGVRVPEDTFIIGFGNSEVSEAITPSITTLESNYVELGRQAVKLHQFLLHNPDIACSSVLVDCPFIERNSTGSLKFRKAPPQSRHDGRMPLYDTDPDILMILQTEELLRMWDDIDRSIINGLLQNKTIVSIADGLFISVSAVKYRIKKMLTAANLQSKDELVHIIKKYNVL